MYISVLEATQLANVSNWAIYRWLGKSKENGVKKGRFWKVNKERLLRHFVNGYSWGKKKVKEAANIGLHHLQGYHNQLVYKIEHQGKDLQLKQMTIENLLEKATNLFDAKQEAWDFYELERKERILLEEKNNRLAKLYREAKKRIEELTRENNRLKSGEQLCLNFQ